jgi:hypothetical protein
MHDLKFHVSVGGLCFCFSGAPHTPLSQSVLSILADLNVAAIASERGGGSVGEGRECVEPDSEEDEGAGSCDLSIGSEGPGSGSGGGVEGGPQCCWQDLHELHVDVVEVSFDIRMACM